ncbi:MAG: zinc ribbon domain-containing protein [Tissierellales bacterium]|nr:zinc ribbon domain-containing protein [Tissierellales bacterium]
MSTNLNDAELLQAARCEDLRYEDIKNLTVLGDFERGIVDRLKQAGSHLLQGARGVGKSMLMRQAEIEMDEDFIESKNLSVYINFKTSPLLEGVKIGDKNGFQVWVGAKILQTLHKKLLFLNLINSNGINDPYQKIFKIESQNSTQEFLNQKIHLIQNIALGNLKEDIDKEFVDKVNNISFVRDTVNSIISGLGINRLIFLFDEVAHSFIPQQQEIFFEIYKLLHGNSIAVKAAVYPTVTSYGKNFEIGHDAILISLDRFETGASGLGNIISLFRDILLKRIKNKPSLKKQLFSKGDLLDQCIYASTGNPRAFFHILLNANDKGYNLYGVQSAIQEYVDIELLPYHSQVAKRLPRFAHHCKLGLELTRNYIIQQIKEKNYRDKKTKYQSAFFTMDRDSSPNLKISLDLLCYSGILSKKGTVKIANRRTGQRYMVNLALMVTEKAFLSNKISDAVKSLSLTDYREFSSSDSNIVSITEKIKEDGETCSNCGTELSLEAKFCSNCGSKVERERLISVLLDDSIEKLPIGWKIAQRVKKSHPKVGDILQASRDELMSIYYVGNVKSRLLKNAAEEYISG